MTGKIERKIVSIVLENFFLSFHVFGSQNCDKTPETTFTRKKTKFSRLKLKLRKHILSPH